MPRSSVFYAGRPTRPTNPHSPTPTPTDPKRSPQPIIALRRESQQQSKAAPRRAGPYEVGLVGLRMSARGTRGRIRPDTAAIPTSRSL